MNTDPLAGVGILVKIHPEWMPEGMQAHMNDNDGTLTIVDAQDHIWVILELGAPGDPAEWAMEIAWRVMTVLGVTEVDGEEWER